MARHGRLSIVAAVAVALLATCVPTACSASGRAVLASSGSSTGASGSYGTLEVHNACPHAVAFRIDYQIESAAAAAAHGCAATVDMPDVNLTVCVSPWATLQPGGSLSVTDSSDPLFMYSSYTAHIAADPAHQLVVVDGSAGATGYLGAANNDRDACAPAKAGTCVAWGPSCADCMASTAPLVLTCPGYQPGMVSAAPEPDAGLSVVEVANTCRFPIKFKVAYEVASAVGMGCASVVKPESWLTMCVTDWQELAPGAAVMVGATDAAGGTFDWAAYALPDVPPTAPYSLAQGGYGTIMYSSYNVECTQAVPFSCDWWAQAEFGSNNGTQPLDLGCDRWPVPGYEGL